MKVFCVLTVSDLSCIFAFLNRCVLKGGSQQYASFGKLQLLLPLFEFIV